MKSKIILIFIALFACFTFISCKTEDQVTITVVDGTGSGKYKVGATVTATCPLNPGESFNGWLVDGNLTSTANPYMFVARTDLTLTASISGREPVATDYTITYNLDGGTATNPDTYNYRTKTFSLNAPTKEGYVFVGWTYDGVTVPTKSVTIKKGSSGNLSFTAHYEEYTKPETFNTLKIAVFADIQLTTNNQGATANAYISLVDHFKYCKKNNVDVIFMNGDICNNAVEAYYTLYEQALTSVYGTDKTKYPEFVWNMGNHEWWDTQEHNTAEAVTLFKKYAMIESDNLVATSNVEYGLKVGETLPSYYKVIKGVPFLVISGTDSAGTVSAALEAEIRGWLDDIQKLAYVRAGGAIYVAYHCALTGVTYASQGAGTKSSTINEIFKDIPNAIIFTGDTHFPGGNERTINQVNFTNINIGSSSYSRNVNRSATQVVNYYYNMQPTSSGKSMDIMDGEAQFLYEYTETILIVDFNSDGSTTINRYMLDKDETKIRHIGLEWNIPLIQNKDQFTYTNARFKNTEWANTMYGSDGLLFDLDNATTSFNVEDGNMMVYFDDCIAYNYCEHYIIEVIPDNDTTKSKKYDIVSSYYKWDTFSHTYHIILNNIPQGETYKVTVTAYDYFDNPSLNKLESTTVDTNTKFGELIDRTAVYTYSDISRKLNYETTAKNSESSIEYFYQGCSSYKYGAYLFRLILNSGDDCKGTFSVTDWSDVVVTFAVKNDSACKLKFGLTFVVNLPQGGEKWITDCGSEYQKSVEANSNWTTLVWNLTELFGVTKISQIGNLSIKGLADQSYVDTLNGYKIHFFVDNIDIIEASKVGNIELTYPVEAESKLYLKADLSEISVASINSISFKMMALDNGAMHLSIFDNSWNAAFSYEKLIDNGTFKTTITGITVIEDEDGYYLITIDASKLETDNISFLEFRTGWTTGTGVIKDIEINYK